MSPPLPVLSPPFRLNRTQKNGRASLDRNVRLPAPHFISDHQPPTADFILGTGHEPLEAEREHARIFARVEDHVQRLAVVAVGLGNEHVRERDVGEDRSLHGHGVGTVQRRVGQVLVAHQPGHERHDLRGRGEPFVPEGAGLGRLDGEEFRVQLLERVLSDLLVAEFGGTARDEGAQGPDAALVVARIHLVGAAEVLHVELAGFGVADVLVADDGPDAGADVREVSR